MVQSDYSRWITSTHTLALRVHTALLKLHYLCFRSLLPDVAKRAIK